MKILSGFIILFLAFFISAIAAYFSVSGLAAIFPATASAVILMGIALEAGKVASTGWLHFNWKNKKVALPHKIYMVSAIVALMLITSLGIYGFLAKGHLEQQAPLAPIELQIAQKTAQIDSLNKDLASQKVRIDQLDSAVNTLISNNKATQGLKYRRSQANERKQIQQAIAQDTAQIQQLTTDLIPLKLKINDVETKLGPIKYFAQLIGLKDTDAAVRVVILILMFAFDPLALFLVISSTITISEALEKKAPKIDSKPVIETESESEPEIVPETEEPITEENLPEVENHIEILPEKSDKDLLLEILQRKPELLQDIVEAIKEEKVETIEETSQLQVPDPTPSWLDTK